MTLLKPTLQIRRLKVMQGNSIAFDESFHAGVNIIRGANSSGKSTILDLLSYSLGYENVPWKQEALLCDFVLVEIEANGAPLTLRRPISEKQLNPMSVFWGPISDAEGAPYSSWELYPFKRSEKKESFSQVLFRALGMPEVRGFAESNITMHQLLRLLYADQRSPHDTLFRPEPFDTTLTRETVGGYLFGIYDDDLYAAQLRQKDIAARLSGTASELRSIYAVLGRSGQETDFGWVATEIVSLEQQQGELSEKLLALKNSRGTVERKDTKDPGVVGLRKLLSDAKAAFVSAEDRRAKLEVDIADSEQFIHELNRRIESLHESGAAREYMGMVAFAFCPCCLSPTPASSDAKVCALCKSPLGDRAATSQILRMQNELELQRDESVRLIGTRKQELEEVKSKIPALKADLTGLEKEYARQAASWSSPLELEIEGVARKLGQIEQRIRQLHEFQRLGNVVLGLLKERQELAATLEGLNSEIERMKFAQDERKQRARLAAAEILVDLLRTDLPRQKEFIEAEHVDWNFGDNRVTVNGQSNFSESSMVILRHAFHLAMLFASTKEDYFRVPRFVILDGIDDGGLELERNHHFQRLIVEKSAAIEVQHQIIFATSQIEPSLEKADLVVGRSFTPTDKSLRIR